MEDKKKTGREVVKTSTSNKITNKKKPAKKADVPQKDMFTKAQKVAYCNKKYGEGNWEFMPLSELISKLKLEQSFRTLLPSASAKEEE